MKAFVFIFLLGLSYSVADKVIGGADAKPGQFPSMALQMKSNSFFCGGTIITDRTVLSAAHCKQTSLTLYQIVAGTTTISSGGIVKDVVHIIVHEGYNSSTTQNDVMLLRVGTTFRFDDFRFPLSPAAIATVRPADDSPITVAGWGDINIGPIAQEFPDNLQYVEVRVIPDETCNGPDSYDGNIYDGMICIGMMEGGMDTCQGDSGGPAYISGENTVAGITSWGNGCALANYPGVYTDVAYFQEWIYKYIANDKQID